MKAVFLALALAGCASVSIDPRPATATHAWLISAHNRRGTAFPIECRPAGRTWEVDCLTARHVVADIELTEISIRGLGVVLRVRICLKEDAAVVTCASRWPVSVVTLDFRPLGFGEQVWVAGFGGGEDMWLTDGLVSSDRHITASIWPGNSGSPVIAPDGRVVGMATATEVFGPDRVPHMVVIVPVSALDAWLRAF